MFYEILIFYHIRGGGHMQIYDRMLLQLDFLGFFWNPKKVVSRLLYSCIRLNCIECRIIMPDSFSVVSREFPRWPMAMIRKQCESRTFH